MQRERGNEAPFLPPRLLRFRPRKKWRVLNVVKNQRKNCANLPIEMVLVVVKFNLSLVGFMTSFSVLWSAFSVGALTVSQARGRRRSAAQSQKALFEMDCDSVKVTPLDYEALLNV